VGRREILDRVADLEVELLWLQKYAQRVRGQEPLAGGCNGVRAPGLGFPITRNVAQKPYRAPCFAGKAP